MTPCETPVAWLVARLTVSAWLERCELETALVTEVEAEAACDADWLSFQPWPTLAPAPMPMTLALRSAPTFVDCPLATDVPTVVPTDDAWPWLTL